MKTNYFSLHEIKDLAQHSQKIGWFSEADWQCFLRTGVVFGHRLQSGEIVSSAYLSNFDNRIGWLGAVIVNSRFQGKKLGRDLIQKALTIAPDQNFVLGVIATERGKRMFEQGGFVEVGNSHKFIRTSEIESSDIKKLETQNSTSIRKFTDSDLEEVLKLDAEAVGYNRSKLLKERLKIASSGWVLQNHLDELSGFIFSTSDQQQCVLGPVVCSSSVDAIALVEAVITAAPASRYQIDVPHWQSGFIRAISELGFELERICPLLTLKGAPLPIVSDRYFAFISQALG